MTARPTFALHTMGCKLNFYDSEVIAAELQQAGFQRTEEALGADLLILNTCTVTNKADQEARHLIRKFRRRHPGGFLAVTGCYVQAQKQDIEAMEEVDFLFTNVQKYDVKALVRAFHGSTEPAVEAHDIMEQRPAEFRLLEEFEAKTRAFLKVQDGCNLRCAYCIIPFVRGNNRSVPLGPLTDQLSLFAEKGIREVVLTGIHIGTWGRDFRPRQRFSDLAEGLLSHVLKHHLPLQIRISSLDTPEIDEHLIALLQAHPDVLVPHLHLPLQSAHNDILRAMHRQYSVEAYRDVLQLLNERLTDHCLGADVIVGFPGETDEIFEQSMIQLDSIPLDYLHVFPYSNRTGTKASLLSGQINGRTSKNRARRLREWSAKRFHLHLMTQLDRPQRAIVLRQTDPEFPESLSALTNTYINCRIDAAEFGISKERLQGQTITLKLEQHPAALVGRPLSLQPSWVV
jgi:threonylcarbamoyladenosine tRNA methylthiotransferase MtaB